MLKSGAEKLLRKKSTQTQKFHRKKRLQEQDINVKKIEPVIFTTTQNYSTSRQ